MAQCGRFERRILSQSFIEFYEKALPGQRGTRVAFDPSNKEQAFLYLMVPFNKSFGSNEKYREARRGMLQDYCLINKLLHPHITSVVGIACKTREQGQEINNNFYNEGQDFIFVDTCSWSNEDIKQAQLIHDEYVEHGLLAKRISFMNNLVDFPENKNGRLEFSRTIYVKGKDRNKPCICGSGKKIKNCCGKV